MKQGTFIRWYILIYFSILICTVLIACIADKTISANTESAIGQGRTCIIIDAGHGGVDGGATSCTGVLESHINLEIAIRLNDLLHLLGYDTRMIRTTDISVYTQGDTIAQQKASDLKERVRIIQETVNPVLLSIHQNQFSDSRYRGAQVFYAPTEESESLAKEMQSAFVSTVNPGSRRLAKRSTGIYLMEHISCPGVLIECGFLSNPDEEALLKNSTYQQKICCVVASVVSLYLDRRYTN